MLNKTNKSLNYRIKSFFVDEDYLSNGLQRTFEPLLTNKISFKQQDWKNRAVFIGCIVPYSIVDFGYNVYSWSKLQLNSRKLQRVSLFRAIKWKNIFTGVVGLTGLTLFSIMTKRHIEIKREIREIKSINFPEFGVIRLGIDCIREQIDCIRQEISYFIVSNLLSAVLTMRLVIIYREKIYNAGEVQIPQGLGGHVVHFGLGIAHTAIGG